MSESASPRPRLPPLREVIARHKLSARRSLGQHFLLDLNLCARIARAAGNLGRTTVIEVGPGPGGLTRALLEAGAARVVAVERDGRCVAALEELAAAYGPRLEVIEGDALEIDLAALAPAPRHIVANLPYNVATPLLIGWLKQITDFAGLTLMFQKEVADRLTARPRTKEFGRLSVMAQWLCAVRREFNVANTAFTPPPKVASTVVSLTPRPTPLAPADWTALETVTATAFGQRRKMLRKSLHRLDLDLESLGIDPTARAEDLEVEQFCALARA
ncbi:MAG: 16S rRNA (adenine(1518)-N(6)/adenine(1519)-N(6))-dimethyltransferase RsmA, partial [Alphaproteobacteria bacterium]|nr:16S rRNA (adenine(1518)-N(6)/adenine(1519)-N(6))-dimethyltransferase RsmA [Alphaproteobacteria bacterium]